MREKKWWPTDTQCRIIQFLLPVKEDHYLTLVGRGGGEENTLYTSRRERICLKVTKTSFLPLKLLVYRNIELPPGSPVLKLFCDLESVSYS